MEFKDVSSNWKKLQAILVTEKQAQAPKDSSNATLKRKHPPSATTAAAAPPPRKRYKPSTYKQSRSKAVMDTQIEQKFQVETTINAGLSSTVNIGKYIALDCEMVGVGPNGQESALARVSIVNFNGEQVYDSYVQPKEVVMDYRTHVSGIKPSHLNPNTARTFEEVQRDVASILKDRVVVGHALKHDFKVLLLDHPVRDIRDTSRHAPYKKISGGTPKLSLLASQLLGLEIQSGEHSSLEDARACMLLFKRDKDAFEVKRPKGVKKA
ncbi:3'-5' exonuclease [Lithohypha guttulata]|uniref:RNA exonuclease 4 n=1 Tax=Lithohypha guttulata TaxID=1690604 RepID=A0AAN7SZA4_9EURO|nr:3'-5' exonuclease [Lithohypha guttulata]KAK5085582.1 3'-5' exonuclease [Lithohypha guttulata]KAK5103537.1 3'-5' exonuclease [Lithohypha guttulata]